ncbi:MAG: hypothetical protein NVS4B1_20310 [Ktedonobacteraceae bacterium]
MQTNPTSYADINELLALLLSGMQSILSEKLVGVYLYGSLVTGDFDAETSDIDLLNYALRPFARNATLRQFCNRPM